MPHGFCDWPVTICEDCCGETFTTLDPALADTVQQWAASYLWAATGRMYGLCETTYRPCRRDCGPTFGLPTPCRDCGTQEWVNLTCGVCRHGCQCSAVSEVVLEDVQSVTGVRVDGVDLDPLTTVLVYDHSRIVRVDGEQWPSCQELNAADGPGTWSITVQQGRPVPAGGDVAAGILACEFAKACLGDESCRLPRRMQTISRQGVTVGFQDQFENLADMRVGIWEVDAFIEMSRTTKWLQASISSPDWAEPSVLTFPTGGG